MEYIRIKLLLMRKSLSMDEIKKIFIFISTISNYDFSLRIISDDKTDFTFQNHIDFELKPGISTMFPA